MSIVSPETLDWTLGEEVIRQRLRESSTHASSDSGPPSFHVLHAAGKDNVLTRLTEDIRLSLDGPLGKFALAMLDVAEVRVTGDVGMGVGEGMVGGLIRVNGNAADAAGLCMRGGTLAVYGHVGHDCGRFMDGGEIFVRGSAGDLVGAGALSGAIMIGGDVGYGLGDQMQEAVIYVRGSVASLGRGVVELSISAKDRLRLGMLMINAGIKGEPKDFRRYVAKQSNHFQNAGKDIRLGFKSR